MIRSPRLILMALTGAIALLSMAPAMAASPATLHQDGVVIAANTKPATATAAKAAPNPFNVSDDDLRGCFQMRKAPGPFNPMHEYLCAYVQMGVHSLPLADKAKLEQFVKDWQPSVWSGSDYLKATGTEQEQMDRTFALIRRMRDALGNPEPFDYVFTPSRVSDQQKNVVRPQLEGGIGAQLKLENAWQLYQFLDGAIKPEMTDEEKQKLYDATMVISPTHRLVVQAPVQGSPSWGVLKSGDVITAVNGQSIDGMSMENAIKQIRGALGTSLKLEVLRTNSKGAQIPLTFTLLRSNVAQHAVTIQDIDGVRHIKIDNFENDFVVDDFYQALVEAKTKNLKGIVVDVRGNPGGRLDYVKAMLEMVVDRGRILMTRQREPGSEKVIQTEFVMDGVAAITEVMVMGAPETSKQFQIGERVAFDSNYNAQMVRNPGFVDENPLKSVIDSSMPVVVLQNGNSYSASEILAGGISGANRGIVIGQPSAGKDDIMTQLPLPECATPGKDGVCNRGALAVISGLFYPGGNDTDLTGVIPDKIVELAKDFGKTDAQLDAAVAYVKDAAAALAVKADAAIKSKQINSDRFKKRIEERNANDLLPVEKQDPRLQQ